ncbi:MAG: hypothetical protein QXX45_02130, partial [Candidatus Aenigmatarchaeota archaeon]
MRKEFFILLIIVYFSVFCFISYSPTSFLIPTYCVDSDGDCNVERIKYLDGNFELVDLLLYPYGWIIAENFEGYIPNLEDIDFVTLHVYWFTDLGEGARNIYFEYYDGSNWNYCAGPF